MANFDMNELVKLAVDGYKGNVEKFSVKKSQDALREALIEANGGKTQLNYKALRHGQGMEVFAIIEELIPVLISEGLVGDEYFMNLVDYRNMAEGDQNNFLVEDNNLFVVARAADGTQAIRRQRLGGVSETKIDTEMHIVRIYEELNRILAGRVDFNTFVNKVSESFRKQMLDEIYALWSNATATQMGGTTYFPAAGTYNENALLTLIEHVEAAAGGKQATIIGTKAGLRYLQESIQSDGAKDELHNMGYYGKFFGTPCVAVPQRHKVGSTGFVMNDKVLTIVAGDEKPIKVVREGDGIVHMGDPFDNQDLTQEYVYGEKYGMGILLAGGNAGIGRYTIQ
jgi:hypothetical protein